MHRLVSQASPSYSKREKGSGEWSCTRLSLWNAITMIECDIFGHKVRVYVACFVHNLRIDTARVSPLLRLARSMLIEAKTETTSCFYSDWWANKPLCRCHIVREVH